MPFELIPFPLSMIFIVVFGFVVELALWKLRKNGSTYRWLSNIALVFGAIVFVLVLLLFLPPL